MKYSVSGVADVGLVRQVNDDMFLVVGNRLYWGEGKYCEAHSSGDGDFLVVVAGGMGGGQAGIVAARTAVEMVFSAVWSKNSSASLHEIILTGLGNANREVLKKSRKDPETSGRAAKLGLLMCRGAEVCLAQVGGIGIRILRGKEQLRAFWEYETDPFLWCGGYPETWPERPVRLENYLHTCLGASEEFECAIVDFRVRPGDSVLLLTDGVFDRVADAEILDSITELSPESVSRKLVELGKQRGGEDNLTAVLCRFNREDTTDVSNIPLSGDLNKIRSPLDFEGKFGVYLTGVVRWYLENGRLDVAKRLTRSVPDGPLRDFLIRLVD
jgi:protein phosphatase